MELGNNTTKKEISLKLGIPSTTLDRRFDNLILLGVLEKTKAEEGAVQGEYGRTPYTYLITPKVATLWRQSKGKLNKRRKINKSNKKRLESTNP
jgi:predicted ArsR family transcriptional regulator